MSSSPSREEPRASRAGSLSPDKRRAPTGQPARQKENTRPQSNEDFEPDGSNPRSLSQKSNSPRSRLAAPGSSDPEMRRPPAERPAERQQRRNMKPRRDHLDGPDDCRPQSQPRKPSSQRSRLAPAEGSGSEVRRPPPGRTAQPRPRMNTKPRLNSEFMTEMSPPRAYDPFSLEPYDENVGYNKPSQGSQLNPSKSRFPAAMSACVRGNRQNPNPSGSRVLTCDGNCVWSRKAKAGLDRKDQELATIKQLLEDARYEIRQLKRGTEAKNEAMQAKSFAADQKRRDKKEALQEKNSGTEQRRQDRIEAGRRKRQDELEAKREQRKHNLELEQLKTPEERMAERDAKLQKAKMAGSLVGSVGNLLAEAHKAHSQVQDMQAQTAARRRAQREEATSSGQSPATSRRPTESTARPQHRPAPSHDEDLE